jgi:thiol-disulfide isomerase/thioredoxin
VTKLSPALVVCIGLLLLPGALAPGSVTAATTKATKSAGSKGARAQLETVAARFRTLGHYDIRGRMIYSVDAQGQTQRTETEFHVAGGPGGRLHEGLAQDGQSLHVYADGTRVVTSLDAMKQYTQRDKRLPPADSLRSDLQPGTPGAWTGAILSELRAIADSVASVTQKPRETIEVAGAKIPCDVLEVEYAYSPRTDAARPGPRTVWLARNDGRIVRTVTRYTQPPGREEAVHQSHEIVYERVALGSPAPDSLFVFQAPADFRKVRQFQSPGQEQPDLTGQLAADFTLPDLAGTSHTLSKLRGQVVLLDFWASWCGPCRMTMPVVDKLANEFRTAGLVVYSVNLRETQAVAEGYIKKKGFSVQVLLDADGSVAQKYMVSGIPALIIVGKDGKVAAHMVGAHPEEDLRDALSEAGIR